MDKKALLVDIDLCYGCLACEVACKQEHDLPVGPCWISVQTIGPQKVDGKLKMFFYPMHCMHCSEPACLKACPEDAITKRADGIVLITEDKCTGCLKCMEVCPFGAIAYNPETGLVGKCNLCVELIEQGESPACVKHCPTGALFLGKPNQLSGQIRKRQAESSVMARLFPRKAL